MEPAEIVANRIRRLADPRPALALGIALWAVATVVVLLVADEYRDDLLPVCIAGIIVGLLGFGLFLVQRRAARRGSRGAQVGVEPDLGPPSGP